MTHGKMKDALICCNDTKQNIMTKITNALQNYEVEYMYNNQSEIVISGKSKEDITSIINNASDINKNQLNLMIQFSESNDKVYIRQKFN